MMDLGSDHHRETVTWYVVSSGNTSTILPKNEPESNQACRSNDQFIGNIMRIGWAKSKLWEILPRPTTWFPQQINYKKEKGSGKKTGSLTVSRDIVWTWGGYWFE